MKVNILGVFVSRAGIREARECLSQWLVGWHKGLLHQVVTVNPEFVMEAQKNPEFRTVLNDASLALADGVGLVLASVFLCGWKHRLLRMTGVECIVILAKLCVRNGNSIYFLGAEQGIAERVAGSLQRRHVALRIAGAEEGIKKGESGIVNQELLDREICQRITDAKTDVLLVAFGAPKQDIWIARNAYRLSGVRIAVGVGGAFDYLADLVPRAPAWMRSAGLEWLYRLFRQPQRIGRIVTAVIRFPLAVLFSKKDRRTTVCSDRG